MGTWDIIGYRDDQNPLLALLGPTGGRTCDTPEGLTATGEAFDGYASWYGYEERVIDLCEASAECLGVGVSYVHAGILVPISAVG